MPKGFTRRPAKEAPFEAANKVDNVGFTVGVEAANAINVAMVFNDANYNPASAPAACRAYLSDNADGSTLTATAPTSTAIGTNGIAVQIGSSQVFELVCNASGLVDVTITKNAAHTYYLVVVMPNGALQVSPAIVLV